MRSPSKESTDPNVVQPSALRKRGTPGSSSPAKARQKRRMSMRNRRVSFAPDPELTMIHTFEKDDDHSGGQPSPLIISKIDEEILVAGDPPMQTSHASHPTEVDMELTMPLRRSLNASSYEEQDSDGVLVPDTAHAWSETAYPTPGEITAGLPSLADLAEADELEERNGVSCLENADAFPGMEMDGNITAAVPGLGDLLAEDEEEGGLVNATAAHHDIFENEQLIQNENADMEAANGLEERQCQSASAMHNRETNSPAIPTAAGPVSQNPASRVDRNETQSTSPSPNGPATAHLTGAQAGKWGFVPGGDDTMELDLKGHGRMIMGDHTYARLYSDATTGHTLLGIARPEDTSDSIQVAGQPIVAYANNSNATPPDKDAAGGSTPAAVPDEDAGNDPQAAPNWTAPAFLPPYLATNAAAAGNESPPETNHPALYESPDVTNSSINTMSTRRVSVGVDTRRTSMTSRRASAITEATSGLLAGSPAGVDAEHARPTMQRADVPEGGTTNDARPQGSADTDDLLADEDDAQGQQEVQGTNGEGAGNFFEGGLQHHNAVTLDRISPMIGFGRGLPPVMEVDEAGSDPGKSRLGDAAATTPQSERGVDGTAIVVDRKSTTGGLLKTGGTTDMLLLNGPGGEQGLRSGPHTQGTHGTTRLLKSSDATGSSAIAQGATAQAMGGMMPTPLAERSAAVEPHSHGGHNNWFRTMVPQSPVVSALSNGSGAGRSHVASPGMGAGAHSVHSVHSISKMGATPANNHLARTPGSAAGGGMALMPAASAGGAMPSHSLPPPGSAIAARYPGSAVATGRLSQGFTPSLAPPITFQDFAKIVEVQFLDNLRRGASINYADLQPNPVPANLIESYTLLCVTGPNVAELETAIHTLQTETSRLRANAAELEVMLGQANPPIFRHVQAAGQDQLDAFRSNVQLLKKVCRAKATALLKDVRCQMEQSKAGRLARAIQGLKGDLAQVNEFSQHTAGVAEAAFKFASETRGRLAQEAEARAAEAERRRRVLDARAALMAARDANADRRRRLEEANNRVAALRGEREALEAERSAAQGVIETLRGSLDAHAAAVVAAGKEGTQPRDILAKLRAVTALERCLGVFVESARRDALVFAVGPLFRLRLSITPAGVHGIVELAPASCRSSSSSSSGGIGGGGVKGRSAATGASLRSLAAAMAGCAGGPLGSTEAFFVDAAGAPAAVQASVAGLQRCMELAEELNGARLSCRHLVEAVAARSGGIRVLFSGIDSGTRFEVIFYPGHAYPLGPLLHDIVVWYDGHGHVSKNSIAAAVATVPPGPGRLRSVCAELSKLIEMAAPMPAGQASAFVSKFGNPLFTNGVQQHVSTKA